MTALIVMAWWGTALQLAGALFLAGRLVRPRLCYAIMGPGALILLGVAVCRQDWPQTALMGAFACINAWGLARWRR